MKMKQSILFLLIILAFQYSCNKEFDYEDYESRIEYVKNIRPAFEFLQEDTLTVVTWNIKLAFGLAGEPWSDDIGGSSEQLDSIVEHLQKVDPDIIFLQEVPVDRENTVIKKVLDSIAVRLNYNYAFGGHGFNSNGTYPTRAQWGNGTLSKYEIAATENREVFNLQDKWSRRSVLRATIHLRNNFFIDTYNLHYSTDVADEEELYQQVVKTDEFLDESMKPKILGGDFNYIGKIDGLPNLTNCEIDSLASIDRVYISDTFETLDFFHIEGLGRKSDHEAMTAVVKFK